MQRDMEAPFDSSSNPRFFDYYARASQSPETLERFAAILEGVLRLTRKVRDSECILDVGDVGCGAGTQSMLWAQLGHRVHGLDVNEPLLQLAQERARQAGLVIDFRVGSAVRLPWPDESMDVCLAPELLEHVAEWESCLREFTRILRNNGVLFLTTTNKLCPVQREFNLPLYSWYPDFLKKHFERLAVTCRPDLVSYATYPAVNWFTFYRLRDFLVDLGFRTLDRFELVNPSTKGRVARMVLSSVRSIPGLRWLAHVATPFTLIVGIKGTPHT